MLQHPPPPPLLSLPNTVQNILHYMGQLGTLKLKVSKQGPKYKHRCSYLAFLKHICFTRLHRPSRRARKLFWPQPTTHFSWRNGIKSTWPTHKTQRGQADAYVKSLPSSTKRTESTSHGQGPGDQRDFPPDSAPFFLSRFLQLGKASLFQLHNPSLASNNTAGILELPSLPPPPPPSLHTHTTCH